LFEAWFEKQEQQVHPPLLLNGDAVMELLGLPSGPAVGRLLEDLREAQAAGDVRTVVEAEALLRHQLKVMEDKAPGEGTGGATQAR
jgi:hypothetical protein